MESERMWSDFKNKQEASCFFSPTYEGYYSRIGNIAFVLLMASHCSPEHNFNAGTSGIWCDNTGGDLRLKSH